MLCITNHSIKHQSFVYRQLNVKIVLFQTIQFRINPQFKCQTVLSGATTPGQSRHRGDGNEEVLSIPQSSSITAASPSDCLVSYLGSYPSIEMQLVYSTAPANWALLRKSNSTLNSHKKITTMVLFIRLLTRCLRLDFSLGFSVWWHINLRGLFNAKAILVEEKQWYYSTHSWGSTVRMNIVKLFDKSIYSDSNISSTEIDVNICISKL